MTTVSATQPPRYISCADTAKLVRAALKKAHSGVTFSVRSSTYSGGASIRISWMDGPIEGVVRETIKGFEGAMFDGMIDLKSYHTGLLDGERVYFGADFIFTERRYSTERMRDVAAKVAAAHSQPAPAIITDPAGYSYFEERQPIDLIRLIRDELSTT